MNVLAALQGISIPTNELVGQLAQIGWELGRVDFKDNQYVAEATNQQLGRTLSKTGPAPEVAIANLLLAAGRLNHIRSYAMFKGGMWQHTWTDRLQDIADAYRKAPIYDPKAVAAYKMLADDSMHRADMLSGHIAIEPTNDPTPYGSAAEMRKDIREKRHYYQSRPIGDHPVWTSNQAAAFKTVHDILGHGVAGGEYDWHGRNLATAAHAPLLDPIAQQALFTEAVARPAFHHTYGHGPHKIALFPEFLDHVQAEHNPPNHRGVHPSQSVPPVELPSITAGTVTLDPNHGWQSGIEPLSQNAYLHHGDPLEAHNVSENARLIDTGWSQFKQGDGTPDREKMKLAIENAFKVVLLSPRKDLRWNAIHYQDVADMRTSDPAQLWARLESRRRAWNEKQGIDPNAHMIYFKFLKPFQAAIYARNPQVGYEAARKLADDTLFKWWTEEQQEVEREDAEKPADKQRSADEIERRANERLAKRLQVFLKPKVEEMDHEDGQMSMLGSIEVKEAAGGQYNLLTGEEALKYGAFMGTHLKAISQISQHADDILDAALEDVRDHDATGHHFRAKVLSLGISGVGPKVCSFAWLLLQPMTSQLGTIDTHMMDVLGHDYEKEMNNRDYFKFERELQAGRDAAGYSHIPLGQFQWGMWDHKRTGPGSHQDHSAMRVIDPKPHADVDWVSKALNLKGEAWLKQGPDWWQNTQAARDQVGNDWDQTYGKNFRADQIPYQAVDEAHVSRKIKTATKMKTLVDTTGLSVQEIWAQYPEGPTDGASSEWGLGPSEAPVQSV